MAVGTAKPGEGTAGAGVGPALGAMLGAGVDATGAGEETVSRATGAGARDARGAGVVIAGGVIWGAGVGVGAAIVGAGAGVGEGRGAGVSGGGPIIVGVGVGPGCRRKSVTCAAAGLANSAALPTRRKARWVMWSGLARMAGAG